MKRPKIVTIGVYGFDETGFFEALRSAGVDVFCDIRARRGVRGSTYAFANSVRLQARLAEMGVRYLHRKDLAPTQAVRDRQAEADRASNRSLCSLRRTGLCWRLLWNGTRAILFDVLHLW